MEASGLYQCLDCCALLVVDGATAVVRGHKNAPYKQTKEELSVWSIVVCAPCREELFSKLSDFLGQ